MKKKLILIISLAALAMLPSALCWSQTAEDYYYKANMNLTSGNIAESVSLYKMAAEKKPGFFEAYLGLSIAYREMGNYEEAHKAILKVLEIKPDYYQVYYNLGLILEKQGNKQQAIKAYERFLDKVPGASSFTDVKQRIARLKAS